MSQQPDPNQLAEAISGMSEAELAQSVTEMGADTVLTAIFSGMEEAFIPEKAGGVKSTIQYDIKAEGAVKQWTVQFDDGKCVTSEGAADSPRLTLELELLDFIRLIFGQAQGPQLFMTGKLKLKGDMMFAMQMQGYFNAPGAAS